MPTNEIGPAKAATQDERIPVISTSSTRNAFMFTPRLLAYPSPIRYAPIGLEAKKIIRSVGNTIKAEICTSCQVAAEKLPIDQWVRFTISESFAKLMSRSVIAEQM